MRTVRIFISSPGDVAEEREKARQVLAALQGEYGGAVTLLPVMWEDLAIPATAPFQEGIDFLLSSRHRIDIAVFILWSRLGSPLGPALTKRDGSPYLSGTEREFDVMLSAFEQSGKKMPVLLAYTRDDLEGFNERLDARTQDHDALEEILKQRKLVKQFVRERFHDEEGRNLRAYYSYREPVGFAQRLHGHLREVVDELLGLDRGAVTWHEAPYRSLEVFDVQHALIFCGRDQEICELTQRLREQQQAGCAFAVIVGASGSGKSSLARAGVAATLMRRSFDEGVQEWRAATFIPGYARGELFAELARALAEKLPELREGVGGLEKFASSLAEGKFDAAEILLATAVRAAEAQIHGRLRLLLVLDQMEELWTDRTVTEAAREAFLAAVEFMARSGAVSVLATLRSDFYPQAQLCPAFLRMKGERGHYDLTPPGTAALQALITRPAQRAGWRFEHDARTGRSLDQKILEDAARDPSALPLLQYALAELHERSADRESGQGGLRTLQFSVYVEMGGVEGALGRRAQQSFVSLSPEAQEALPTILPSLISIDTAGEQNAVRSRAPLEEVTAAPGARELVDALVRARFLTTDQHSGVSIVTLAHESLMRRWERVAEWINTNRNQLLARARVQQIQTRWEEAGRDASLLLAEGLALEEGRALLKEAPQLLTPSTRGYIEESLQAAAARRNRQQKLRRLVVGALSSMLILSLVAAGWAWKKQGEATEQETVAKNEAKNAETALANAKHQLERSTLAEGRAWLAEARKAETERKPFLAIMLAGRASGFRGYGWREADEERFGKDFPPLLSQPFADTKLDQEREVECEEVHKLIARQSPSGLLIWSSPVSRHHDGPVSSVAFSPDGTRIASGSDDKTVKLWDAASGKELASLHGHTDRVTSVAFSPDRTRIVSGSDDKTVKLWDAASVKELVSLQGHTDRVTSVTFSPDGTRIASGSDDKTVKLWDAASGKELASLHGHTDPITSVAFSPDGTRIASGSWDQTVKLWDAASGKELASLQGHTDPVSSVAFSPDGTRIASGSWDQTVKLWDAASGKELASLHGHTDRVTSVAFSPDRTRIASGSDDKTVKLWDAASGKELAALQGHTVSVLSVAFSPDGTRIASGSDDKTVKLWDAASGKELASLQGHMDRVSSLAFSPDGTCIASGYWDRTVKLRDATNGKELPPRGNDGDAHSVAFSPDGTRIASGCWDRTVKLRDAAGGRELASLHGHTSFVSSVAFSPDGTRIASGSDDKTVKLWDAASGKELFSLHGHTDHVSSVAFSPDGTRIASGSWDKTVRLWDAASGKELASLQGHTDPVTSVAFSPNGTRIASGSDDKTAKLWDAASGKELASLQGHMDDVTSVAFSPDGRRIASGSDDDTVKLWDVANDKQLTSLQGHTGRVTSMAFSPNGARVASGSFDWTVKLWDAVNGKELASLQGHTDPVTSVAFSPNGARVASGCWGRTVKLWDTVSGKELVSLQGHTTPVTSVAFSPDGTRIASRSEDDIVKLWDTASGKELPGTPDFPIADGWTHISRDGKQQASVEDATIVLEVAHAPPDLMHFQREGLLRMQKRDMAWQVIPDSNLLSGAVFTMNHPRPDEMEALSHADLPERERNLLRLRLMFNGAQWRTALSFWRELDAGLQEDETREMYLTFLLVQAREMLEGRRVCLGVEELLGEIAGEITSHDCTGTALTLPLCSLLRKLAKVREPAAVAEASRILYIGIFNAKSASELQPLLKTLTDLLQKQQQLKSPAPEPVSPE